MLTPLIVLSAMGITGATTALWVEGRPKFRQCLFAPLVSFSMTVSLFSMIAWTAGAIVAIVPLWLTRALVGALAPLFAFRLYRELRALSATDWG
jgi:hypothetical protein